ncbi:hypothetical protein cyc_05437 [Cyclospora cayetanensis]|uniref:Uncharacterized protein n=1 Tax=Cyclospora cayetanensis TaxID=88456 RepID=A0A1D3CXJ9_9EIME|nr:hypothetical protein cyc_05437 [Cyclospora cayetanensis]
MRVGSRAPGGYGPGPVRFFAHLVFLWSVQSYASADRNPGVGGTADQAVQVLDHEPMVRADEGSFTSHSVGALGRPIAERGSADKVVYMFANKGEEICSRRKQKSSVTWHLLSRLIKVGLFMLIIAMAGKITWELMNYVGDVPDPFADVKDRTEIPNAIQELLAGGKPLAFVIRELKKAGMEPVRQAVVEYMLDLLPAFWAASSL